MKKIFAMFVCLVIVIASMSSISVSAATKDYEQRYAYTLNSYDSTDKVLAYSEWYMGAETEYFYPDYFGGFKLLEDGKLAFLVTDDSETVRASIVDIVGDDVSFIKVEHSFNDLYSMAQMLAMEVAEDDSIDLRVRINIADNVVDVCTDNYSVPNTYSCNSMMRVMDSVMWEEELKESENTLVPLTDEEMGLTSSRVCVDSNEVQPFALRATSTITPGMRTCFQGYDPNDHLEVINGIGYGTVGFCALNTRGERLLITHGHGVIAGEDFKVINSSGGYTKIGTVNRVFYIDNVDAKYDFALVSLDSGVKISNRIYGTSMRITGSIESDYLLSSYIGLNVYARGARTNVEVAGILGYEATAINGLYVTGTTAIQNGDSGAPIYLKTREMQANAGSTDATLLGIVRYLEHGNTYGCTLQTIKECCRNGVAGVAGSYGEITVFRNSIDY